MEASIFILLAVFLTLASLIQSIIIGENIELNKNKSWLQKDIVREKPYTLSTQKGLLVRTVYPKSNSKSINMVQTLQNYEKKRNLKKVKLVGFKNFNLVDGEIKINGYYKKGYLRKEKHLTVDNFDKIKIIGLDRINDESMSVECIGYLKGEKHLLQLIYIFPASKSINQ